MRPAVYTYVVIVCFFVSCHAAQPQANACSGTRYYGEYSDTVLTGTVLRLDKRDDRAEVNVKRVMRGPENLLPGNMVRVEGVTNMPCHGDATIRTRDTRIFMLENLPYSDMTFRLNGTLLKITVPNLERVSAVVKGEPYQRRPPIKDKPCEKKYCPWGGECLETGSLARCECPETCPVGYTPVCGSNGVTYVNECRLRRESCKKKIRLYLKYIGPCAIPTSG